MEELSALDRLEEVRGLTPEENQRKCLVIRDLENSILREEISWRQKSRVLGLKEFNKCTKFFHQVANSNRRFNAIESLCQRLCSSDQSVIKDYAAQLYETLFVEPYSWQPRLDDLAFDSLDAVEASSLQLPYKKREVLEVVNGMNKDKALAKWVLYCVLQRLLGRVQE
jgi:hypothetical protein